MSEKMTLEERVIAFKCMELPGQPMGMHMGTSYLVDDLWREIQRMNDAMKANDTGQEDEMRRETHDELAARMLNAGRQMPTLSQIRHVKSGGLYRVHDIALDESTLDPVVIYAPDTRPDVRFMRPLSAMLARFVIV